MTKNDLCLGQYRKKPVVVTASKWFENGDHPQDNCEMIGKTGEPPFLSEGKVVRYFRNPEIPGTTKCKHCLLPMHSHGWIDTLEGGHIVCPGDWIITGSAGERYPCKPRLFAEYYERV